MDSTFILIYIYTASSIPIFNVLGHDEFGVLIKTNKNTTFLLKDAKALFAGSKTPVWVVEHNFGDNNVTFTGRENLLSKVLENFVKYWNNVNLNETIPFISKTFKSYTVGKTITCSRVEDIEDEEGIIIKAPPIVYPQILVFVDFLLYEQFNNDLKNTVTYVLTLLNSVDLNFRIMNEPKVRLNIAGIVVDKYNAFSNNSEIISTFKYQFDKLVPGIKLEKFYDIAVLIKAKTTTNENCIQIAATPCLRRDTFDAIIYDDMMFSGINYVTALLAYLFGARYDGSSNKSYRNGPDSKNCSYTDGFIMGVMRPEKQQFFFSNCSLKMMSFFFSLEKAKCFHNNPGFERNDIQVPILLPGLYMNLNEQCQIMGYTGARDLINPDCLDKHCFKNNKYQWYKTYSSALEGTDCGSSSYCIRGECVKIEVENIKGKTEETDNEDKEYNQEVPENSKMPKFSKASNLHSNSNKLNSSILVFLIIISFFSLF